MQQVLYSGSSPQPSTQTALQTITTWNMSPAEKKKKKIHLFANNHAKMHKIPLNGFVSCRTKGLCYIDWYDKRLKTIAFTASVAYYQQMYKWK